MVDLKTEVYIIVFLCVCVFVYVYECVSLAVFANIELSSTKASDKQIQELFQQIGDVVHVEIFPKEK